MAGDRFFFFSFIMGSPITFYFYLKFDKKESYGGKYDIPIYRGVDVGLRCDP